MSAKLAIFDLDGTLAHTAPDLLATLNRVTKPHGIPSVDASVVGKMIGQGAREMIIRAFDSGGKKISSETLNKLFEEFLEDYARNISVHSHLFEGAEVALETLSQNGFHLAVCTNKTEQLAVKLLRELGVLDRFSVVTGGNTFSFRKPDPKHLLETAAKAGIPDAWKVMIGDSSNDIDAANSAGMASVAVTFGYSDIPAEQLGATSVINHYADLYPAIDRLIEQAT